MAPVREIAVFAEAAGGFAEPHVASVREIAVFAEAQVASVREIAVFADVQVAPRPEAPKFAIFPLERKFVYIYIYIWAKAYKGTPTPANTCSIKKQKEFFSSSHFLKLACRRLLIKTLAFIQPRSYSYAVQTNATLPHLVATTTTKRNWTRNNENLMPLHQSNLFLSPPPFATPRPSITTDMSVP